MWWWWVLFVLGVRLSWSTWWWVLITIVPMQEFRMMPFTYFRNVLYNFLWGNSFIFTPSKKQPHPKNPPFRWCLIFPVYVRQYAVMLTTCFVCVYELPVVTLNRFYKKTWCSPEYVGLLFIYSLFVCPVTLILHCQG